MVTNDFSQALAFYLTAVGKAKFWECETKEGSLFVVAETEHQAQRVVAEHFGAAIKHVTRTDLHAKAAQELARRAADKAAEAK